MNCSSCGVENPAGSKFCHECGSPLVRACPGCGVPVLPAAKFCHECGTTLAAVAQVRSLPSPPAGVQAASAATELRHVSVLFCDLVGFTPFSESRDPEEVRELLSGYFELARAIVARYGGTVEKFIGDAVMAVWGAPVAKEDDAERAVRAGLELVSAVAAYGAEHGTGLQARVGVVTGGAATTTAEEGLVIGDRVNTAARIQSAAPPGCCYVDETTRAATSAAIAYSDAGMHELKGKADHVHLFQATQVVAAIAGSQRSGVIEAPFIGRDHELRLVKELFHAAAERSSARLVLVSGVAGVGKSRLAWEFFKYIDGLAGDVLWHSGRCLSYGEGVSYWALSEMVRARFQISEEDPLDLVAERLRTGLERWIPDAADREFIAPRLGQLLGLPTNQVLAKEELFSGWRLFFERLAEFLPVLLVIEDLQWADAGLVDFLDHLLEWSGDHAIFLLVLSRPEGTDRGGLMLSRRSVTTLPLDPLSDEVMGSLLDGLVTDLPAPARSRIVERAEGIPLYAIETVRSLLDKGALEKSDDGLLHLVGELGELAIPPGLTALIASRLLDVLGPDERRLVKECSVLGTSFSAQAVEAVTDLDPSSLDELLSSLVRKEVLTVRADKLSPERGQYAFTQSLIRSVAYDMLSRSERKARHLRTAAHMRAAFPDEGAEVAEVIGAHLFDAYKAAGDDPDADELRSQARDAYNRAAERAASVGALEAAESAYLKAAELSSDDVEKARFTEAAGRMARGAGWQERAIAHFEAAIAVHASAGRIVDVARITSPLAEALDLLGRGEISIVRIREAIVSLGASDPPPEVLADLQARLAGALLFSGHLEEANEAAEQTLTLAQHHELSGPLARGLNAKAILLATAGRAVEARMFLEEMAAVSRESGLTREESTAENNLADVCMTRDLPGSEEHARAAVVLARRWGRREEEAISAGNLIYVLTMTGRLDEAYQLGLELLQSGGNERPGSGAINFALACLDALRGNVAAAREHAAHCRAWQESDDVQQRAMFAICEASVALAEGNNRQALDSGRRAIDEGMKGGLGVASETFRTCFPIVVDAAIGLGELGDAERLVAMLASRPRGEVPPFLVASVARAEALLAKARDQYAVVEDKLLAAEATFRELGYPYWEAKAQLDQAEWLRDRGRADDAAKFARLAGTTFEQVGASLMAARARALLEAPVSRTAAGVELQASS